MVFRRVVSIIYQKFYLSDRVPLSITTVLEGRCLTKWEGGP